MRRIALLVAAVVTILSSRPASATMLDANFTESTFVSTGLSQVTGMAWAPDGSQRLFLSQKTGPVRIVENGVLLPTPFATISPVYTNSECGVIGLAFDPSFATNGYVYFFVTVSSSEQQIIRYTANGNTGSAKTTIVPGLPTVGANHDGGSIGFGGDGKIYWGIGDNGNGRGVDADLTLLAAKIGRANADGSVPSDNPFIDGSGPNADLIWARGFRNPFTLTVQPSTERIWVNTVGTNYEQVFVPQRGDHAGYNDYENNQPASGYITPVIVYRTNNSDSRTITASGASRSGGVATFTTTGNHGFRLGGKITITGVTDSSFNGSGYVSAVPSNTQFRLAQAGPDATSGSGNATTLNIGGAITGGAFLESTAVPAAYRGNYFFGDYNSQRIERATLDGSNVVTSVDHWANNLGSMIDIELGPDGNLYYVNHAGLVRRATYNTTTQALVVSPRYLRTSEGGATSFYVRLAVAPSGTVNVAVSRASGDADITVSSGASLSFGPGDWSTPKPVRIAAAQDADSVDDSATIAVESSGLTTENVVVRVTDNNTRPPTDGGTDATGGTGGTAGTNGSGGTAGTNGSGGTAGTNGSGGTAGTNGSGGTAGTNGSGGTAGTNGSGGTAGTNGSGGMTDSGTDSGTAGTNGAGGTAGTDGAGGSTGSGGAGGIGGASGASGSAGVSGSSAADGSAVGGAAGTRPRAVGLEDDSGCGCRSAGSGQTSAFGALALMLVAAMRRRRARRART